MSFIGGRKSFSMKFDSTTLKSDLYLSPDGTVLSDYSHADVQQFPAGPNTLTTYPGVIVDNCVQDNRIVYYKFNYEYTLQNPLTGTLIAIELGIADRAKVDNSVYAGASSVGGWSFPINKCPWNEVCLEAWHDTVGSFEIGWSPNTAGYYKSGSFLVVINRKDNLFTLYNGVNSSKIFEYAEVISLNELCPIFSVQGKQSGGLLSKISLVEVNEVL